MAFQCRRTVIEWFCSSCGHDWAYFPYRDPETKALDLDLMKRYFCCEVCKAMFSGIFVGVRGVNEKRLIPLEVRRRKQRARMTTTP